MAKQTRKLVYLEWVDAVGPADSSWLTQDEVEELLGREMLIRECGWIINENRDYISLVAGLSEEPPESEWTSVYHRMIRIPRDCIRKRKDLTRFI